MEIKELHPDDRNQTSHTCAQLRSCWTLLCSSEQPLCLGGSVCGLRFDLSTGGSLQQNIPNAFPAHFVQARRRGWDERRGSSLCQNEANGRWIARVQPRSRSAALWVMNNWITPGPNAGSKRALWAYSHQKCTPHGAGRTNTPVK